MVDKPNGGTFYSRSDEANFVLANPTILTLETPNVEDIAKAIWQRQHDTLVSDAISYGVKWRDQSIPARFWEEFLQDAHAVLLLLREKDIEYRNVQESTCTIVGQL
jgi:hypothetical protein